jgi:hypothetical protein
LLLGLLAPAWAAQAAAPAAGGPVDLLTEANIRLDGADSDFAGSSVAGAGDVNGDGLADVIVGAPGFNVLTERAYVVFGSASRTTVDLGALGANGFVIQGVIGERVGQAVAGAGDVNGDGLSDVIVGAHQASYNGRVDSGSAYVVFGKASSTTVDLAALGSAGFRIDGAVGLEFPHIGEEAGKTVAGAGDVNQDGLADLVVGAPLASPSDRVFAGSVYVVFGKTSPTPVDLAALGTGGFRIDGPIGDGQVGERSVAGAGDVNGDGVPDIIVFGPPRSSAYVVFGKASSTTVDLAALGAAGFLIDGAAVTDSIGGDGRAGAGDMNGDGRADLIVGLSAAGGNGRENAGSAYVVFGKASSTTVDLTVLGTGGFRIDGQAPGDQAGSSVDGVGDVNGDGRPDVIVGAPGADNNSRLESGSAYVVFGKASSTSVDLAALDAGGFRVDGAAAGDLAGLSVAGAGDVGGDGSPDVVLGAPGSNAYRGAAYVVFGFGSLTPRERLERLRDDVEALATAGTLSQGLARSLGAKLDAASASLGRGNPRAAGNQLRAFVNQVQALVRSGRLSQGAGGGLIEQSGRIIAALETPQPSG